MLLAEENVDTVVSEGGIRHVVPLLTFFPPPAADSKDRRYVSWKLFGYVCLGAFMPLCQLLSYSNERDACLEHDSNT